jgi:hypothetical protein
MFEEGLPEQGRGQRGQRGQQQPASGQADGIKAQVAIHLQHAEGQGKQQDQETPVASPAMNPPPGKLWPRSIR